MLIFARVLPLIRARVDANFRRHSLPREQVLAAVVRLLELTLLRVGNDGYAKANKSFGLTTLRDRHAEITGSHIHLRFRGKGGARYETDINDPRVRASSNLAETFPATSYSNISTMPASAIPSVRQRSTPISARSPAKT
jgi:DNA topoisomerase-1